MDDVEDEGDVLELEHGHRHDDSEQQAKGRVDDERRRAHLQALYDTTRHGTEFCDTRDTTWDRTRSTT